MDTKTQRRTTNYDIYDSGQGLRGGPNSPVTGADLDRGTEIIEVPGQGFVLQLRDGPPSRAPLQEQMQDLVGPPAAQASFDQTILGVFPTPEAAYRAQMNLPQAQEYGRAYEEPKRDKQDPWSMFNVR